MEKRFQVYVRYNRGENIIAMHLQWCWGHYAIQTAAQLLDFINKNTQAEYSHFLKKDFKMKNKFDRRDYQILSSLIQLNLRDGSYVRGIDLVEAASEYEEYKTTDYVKINPFQQDNDDGFLVIDIIENKGEEPQIKYCFDLWRSNDFIPISANRYYEEYEGSDYEDCLEWDSEDTAYFNNLEKTLAFIEKFDLLNEFELELIFDSYYSKEKNLIKKSD